MIVIKSDDLTCQQKRKLRQFLTENKIQAYTLQALDLT
jgi:hypothetical protein